MRIQIIVAAALCCIGTKASASDVLAGGPIYGGNTQTTAVCHVFNSGGHPAVFDLVRIIDQNGNDAVLDRNSCSPSIDAARSCAISATIRKNLAYSCQMTMSTSKANLRGSMDIRGSGVILVNIELR
jgi:hypothetical protein